MYGTLVCIKNPKNDDVLTAECDSCCEMKRDGSSVLVETPLYTIKVADFSQSHSLTTTLHFGYVGFFFLSIHNCESENTPTHTLPSTTD